ncbi:hypothetical protein AKJ41_03335 [candidate division MSBL1 archaeon SCGC-AAA259O05]|uniref:Uncharacterized protein n=1 Tax=candidate division MSBL1 archaeon SCGC-AAA259O05 TaxID=1698271 RepID=A0A133V3E4_9EURY|nr:hypothetical protein AKJ41_03335 [candidate division MSBL1 archaeon SCGC-AAA259O05]
MDERTRILFKEFAGRGLMGFLFSLLVSGGFLYGAGNQVLLEAQLVLLLCLSVDLCLLGAQLSRKGGFDLLSYYELGPSPFKIAASLLVGALAAATVIRSFGSAAWAQLYFGTLIVSACLFVLWWKMD